MWHIIVLNSRIARHIGLKLEKNTNSNISLDDSELNCTFLKMCKSGDTIVEKNYFLLILRLKILWIYSIIKYTIQYQTLTLTDFRLLSFALNQTKNLTFLVNTIPRISMRTIFLFHENSSSKRSI